MTNIFSIWTDMMSAGRMVGETLEASQSVIASRSETIAAATRNPFDADHRELNRMVSEKSSAFARSGAILAEDWTSLNGELFAQAHALGAMWFGGRLPSTRTAKAMLARSQRISQHALSSSVRALAPIHATATANKRRLARAR